MRMRSSVYAAGDALAQRLSRSSSKPCRPVGTKLDCSQEPVRRRAEFVLALGQERVGLITAQLHAAE